MELRDVYVPEKIGEITTILNKDVTKMALNAEDLKKFTKDTFFELRVEVDGFRD